MTRRSRRDFMIGAGAAALTLPFLRTAQGIPLPTGPRPPRLKRVVIFYCAQGRVAGHWAPQGQENDFTLSPELQPLDPFKDDLLVLDNVGLRSAWLDTYGAGHSQIAHVLTSTRSIGAYHPAQFADQVIDSAGGVSVDQYIAQHIGQSTPFASLEFGVQIGETALGWERVSYDAPHQPRQADEDPYHAYSRIFGASTPSQVDATRQQARRHSVLDYARQDVSRLRAQLGARDQQRLEAHLDSLRDLERSLDTPVGAQCQATPFSSQIDVRAPENYPAVLRMQTDLLVMSLACGRTKVALLQASGAQNYITTPTWLGINDTCHNVQHNYARTPDDLKNYLAVQKWYAEQFAYLLARLRAIPEGDGTTMLDNTAVLWADSLGEPSHHSSGPVPCILAGGRNYFRTGRYVQMPTPAQNCGGYAPYGRLLVSLCQSVGIETDTFGDPHFCQGGAFGELV